MPIGLWLVVIISACIFSFLSKLLDSNRELAELAKTPADPIGATFTLNTCLSIVIAFVVIASFILFALATPFIWNAR